MKNFWSLDLKEIGTNDFKWKELPPWPGSNRAFNITVSQHNGKEDCVYVISGRRETTDGDVQFLKDVYEFSPQKYLDQQAFFWRRVADVPTCVMAGPGIAVGQSHIFVLGGDDGSLFSDAEFLKETHPGFPKQAWAYHTITNQWFPAGKLPTNHITTNAIWWQKKIIIPSGETKPRIRTSEILTAEPIQIKEHFGIVNFITIFVYLVLLIVIGIYFSYRNKNTNDFFRGGKRVPWWVAGLSIFATMLSSITFIAIPAKAYATDWTFFLINMAIIAVAPFIVYFVLPFFHRIDATTAYEYLEKRFNRATRMFASASFVFFQLGRMAIVMFLPSLALAAITPFSVESSILIMGVLSIIYCTLGGLEAVVWTDTLQALVLLGGALFSIIFIFFNIDGGISTYFSSAMMDHKLRLVNWNWDVSSFILPALWVIVFGGLGQQLVTGTSDQAIIQRYMSVSNEKKAARAIWTNAIFTVPASILFFGVGTALYVFYKFHPEKLDPTFQTDAVFPLFIGRELPAGIAGLVVAGIFAAAQSTISTSMNSTATAIVSDFIRPFNFVKSEKNYLIFARIFTLTLGVLGTGFALMLATYFYENSWASRGTLMWFVYAGNVYQAG
jgi:SSS family transporter